MIPGGLAEKILAGALAVVVALALGFTGGSRWTGARKDAQIAKLEAKHLEDQQKWQDERDAASVRAAEAAAATAGHLATLNQRNARLEQEVIVYASDTTRERRVCFDARGSSLWNAIAAAPAAGTQLRGEPDGAGEPRAAGAASGRGV